MTMKTLVLLLVIAGMLVAAGCTSTVSTPGTSTTTPASGKVLPMQGNTTLGTGNKTVNVFIDSIELEAKSENETGRTLTIYVAARNTGSEPVRMKWYSKLTDGTGKSYGGINVSHNGNGARTAWIVPNNTEAARDFISGLTNQDLGMLSNGAVLDVYFMETDGSNVTAFPGPDNHVAWLIDKGAIL